MVEIIYGREHSDPRPALSNRKRIQAPYVIIDFPIAPLKSKKGPVWLIVVICFM